MLKLRREIVQAPREEVYDLDWLNKVKSKVYTDASRGEMLVSNGLETLKVQKSNKLLTNFRPSPFKVVQKTGTEATVRNEAFVKRYTEQDAVSRSNGENTVTDNGERQEIVPPTMTEVSKNSPIPP